MKYNIIYTDKAKDNLRKISDYIISNTNDKSVASNFILEIEKQVNVLEEFPFSGFYPKNRPLRGLGYRYLVYKEYLIFYIVKDKDVYISTVINSKLDYYRYNKF